MRTVRDESGSHYILLKQSTEASLVRDPESGVERHIPNEDLEAVDGESPLVTAAGAVSEAVLRVVTATHGEQSLGLLIELDRRGPLSVQGLLDSYDLCESDFHGLLTEFRAAGLVEEADVAGHRGYDTTPTASAAIETLTE